MKIVKLKGGLGNQMFQYAFALLLENRTSDNIKLDYSSFQSLKSDMVRVPRLEKFCIHLKKADQNDISSICKLRHNGDSLSFSYKVGVFVEEKINSKYFREHNRAYINPEKILDFDFFDGYWQSWRYVDEVKSQLVDEFKPNYEMSVTTRETQSQMLDENAVFIGVRRGDYAAEKRHYGSFDSSYYVQAINYISQRTVNPIFYVFSNDIEWCKQNLKLDDNVVRYREPELQTNDFEELMLMASCKHAIIVNSSFHWWGANLIRNSEKIICCPEKWWFDDKPIDIIPPKWVRMKKV